MENKRKAKRSLDELNVIDDFLMNAAAADPMIGEAFCRTLLSVLLQRTFGRLHVVTQRVISAPDPKLRGIRMDVEILEVAEDNISEESEKPVIAVYDLEPNLRRKVHLPKHNRFYQAKIDARHLKCGEKDFRKIPRLYVITITDFDPFGQDYMQYTIQNRCKEIPELDYDDELQFLYFYTNGRKGGSSELQAMLKYIQRSIPENVTDTMTKKLHDYVEQIRLSPEVRQSYMTWEDKIYYERKDAKEELLIEQVCKKLKRGKEIAQIADELETEEAIISEICAVAAACAPEYDYESVLERWLEK